MAAYLPLQLGWPCYTHKHCIYNLQTLFPQQIGFKQLKLLLQSFLVQCGALNKIMVPAEEVVVVCMKIILRWWWTLQGKASSKARQVRRKLTDISTWLTQMVWTRDDTPSLSLTVLVHDSELSCSQLVGNFQENWQVPCMVSILFNSNLFWKPQEGSEASNPWPKVLLRQRLTRKEYYKDLNPLPRPS